MNSFSFRQHSFTSWVVLVCTVALTGCGQDKIQVYRVAKEEAPDSQAAALPPGHPNVGASETPSLKWTLPAGWEETTPGEMRLASFRIKGEGGKQADVGIFPLPGMAGRDIDNVNRWRSQVGLGTISEEEMAKAAEAVEVAGQKAQLFDLAGQNPSSGDKARILAVVQRRGDTSWFFKMNGDDDLVAKQKPAFVQFLKSVSFTAPAAAAQLPPSHPPIDASMLAGQGAPAASSGQPKPQWQVPAGWQEVPGGQFLVAKLSVSGGENAQAAVNVSLSAGEGGGVAMNVNRWRGQLGLAPLADAELKTALTSVDTAGGKAMFVDMSGTDGRTGQKARLVAAIVSQSGQTWFYKLMGNEQVVAQQKDAFTKFVQTAQYPK